MVGIITDIDQGGCKPQRRPVSRQTYSSLSVSFHVRDNLVLKPAQPRNPARWPWTISRPSLCRYILYYIVSVKTRKLSNSRLIQALTDLGRVISFRPRIPMSCPICRQVTLIIVEKSNRFGTLLHSCKSTRSM